MEVQMKDLVEWLGNCKGVTSVTPVSVKIGRTTYKGALYTQHHLPLEGARSQEEYDTTSIYLLANDLPPSHKRNPGSVNTNGIHYVDESGRHWYVAGYMLEGGEGSYYHPFGSHFLLGNWPKNLPIYGKFNTMNITVEEVEEK
jgi:hypothetical protein